MRLIYPLVMMMLLSGCFLFRSRDRVRPVPVKDSGRPAQTVIAPPSDNRLPARAEPQTPVRPAIAAPIEPRVEPSASTSKALESLLVTINDAFFDFDSAGLRPDAIDALRVNAAALRQMFEDQPGLEILIEGHCDERGSAEYNLALGDQRAQRAKEFLEQIGVPAGRVRAISYGKERPQCGGQDEDCWRKNRRVHLSPLKADLR